jgi:hypothetical protein
MGLELNIQGFNSAQSEGRPPEKALRLLHCNMNRRPKAGAQQVADVRGERRKEEGLTERH